jgi:hypothetical protein
MDSAVSIVIRQAKALREEHSYGEALRKINDLDGSELSTILSREIAGEKAAILSEQGYVDLAKSAFKDALQYSMDTGLVTEDDVLRHALLEGNQSITMTDSDGIIVTALKVRDNIKSYLPRDLCDNTLSDVLVISSTT